MCHIPGCSFRVMVEPVDECVGAGEVIGAGPHISVFTVFSFPTAFLKNAFLKSEIKQMVFKQRLCCVRVCVCVICWMRRLRKNLGRSCLFQSIYFIKSPQSCDAFSQMLNEEKIKSAYVGLL